MCSTTFTWLLPCRDTGLFVPLLAAVGVASLVSEYAEGIFSEKLETALAGLYLREKLLFWGSESTTAMAADATSAAAATGAAIAAASIGQTAAGSSGNTAGGTATVVTLQQQMTVEAVIATPAKLYVRHTLPLEQAKDALLARQSAAAVVVDDNFTPLGRTSALALSAAAVCPGCVIVLCHRVPGC